MEFRFVRHSGPSIAEARRNPAMFDALATLTLTDPAGSLAMSALHMAPDGPRVGRVTSTGHRVGVQEDNFASLLVPLQGKIATQITQAEWQACPQGGLFLRPVDRLTEVVGPFEGFVLLFPNERLAQRSAQYGSLPDALDMPEFLPGFSKLRRLLGDIHKLGLTQKPDKLSARRDLGLDVLVSDTLIDLIATRLDSDRLERLPRSSLERVNQAEDLMRAQAGEPLSMSDIADAMGISLRSLQLAFQQTRKMGPRDALNQIRLDLARQRLLQARPGETVTSIVMECGVSHLSRFASSYRMAYGEYPAETLAWAVRRAS